MVYTCALGEGDYPIDGYRLIADPAQESDEDFNPADYLAEKSVSLWFWTKMGGTGSGRSIKITKEAEGADKRGEADTERQEKLHIAFARMKQKLGLSKDDVVNYDVVGHSVEVFDRQGSLMGKYDLKDLGASESFRVRGGGGLAQLLQNGSNIYLLSDQLKSLSGELIALNKEIKKLVEPETGGNAANIFEAENKGNIKGLPPFIARGAQAHKVLHGDSQRGFYTQTMRDLGLVNTNSKTWPQSDVHTLNKKGAAAVADMEKAFILQNTIIDNIDQEREKIKVRIKTLTPPSPQILAPDIEQEIQSLQKEIEQLNRVEDEIVGLSSSVSRKIRSHKLEIKRLTHLDTPYGKKSIKRLEKEIQRLSRKQIETEGASPTALHLMIMYLHRSITISHQQLTSEQVTIQTDSVCLGKALLAERMEGSSSRAYYGVDSRSDHEADIMRNNLVDQVAKSVATGFETTALQENSSRKLRSGFRLKPMKFDPKNPAHQEVQQIGTNMGALVYDIAARKTSSDPIGLRKMQFIEERSESLFAQESRALEFLISAAIFDGDTDIRGYGRESKVVQGVMKRSLDQFRAELLDFAPMLQPGAPVHQVRKAVLIGESKMRKAAARP